MTEKHEKVEAFFDKTHLYLDNSFGVALRSLIVSELSGNLSQSAILDIGCGNGAVSLQYAGNGNKLTLIDLSNEMLALARAQTPPSLRDSVEYLKLDYLDLNPSTLFDVVIYLGILAHVTMLTLGLRKHLL